MRESNFHSTIRAIVLAFFPRKDLYRPLLAIALDVQKPSHSIDGKIQHTYAGKYEIGLQVANRISMVGDSYKSNLRIAVRFSASVDVAFVASIGDNLKPWWSHEANGFTLIHYWVPTDLPLGSPVHCVVTVEKPSEGFVETYGGVTLYVRKSSEK
jgi:hypothetical protein